MPNFESLFGLDVWFSTKEGNPLEPIHVHIGRRKGTISSKFWITEDGIELSHNKMKLNNKQIKAIMRSLQIDRSLIINQWKQTFDGEISFYK
ncbi:MAG: DUF4160 domain-containing protein [Turicibacter sp.]|nr:DUF4160 domain-containing protein [Turicibacter sp.]